MPQTVIGTGMTFPCTWASCQHGGLWGVGLLTWQLMALRANVLVKKVELHHVLGPSLRVLQHHFPVILLVDAVTSPPGCKGRGTRLHTLVMGQ